MADKIIGCGRCPRKLTTLTYENCPMGLRAIQDIRNGKEPKAPRSCPWFVNDSSANLCYFKWLAQQGGEPVTDVQISSLLLESDPAIKKIIADFRKRSEALKRDLLD